MESAVEKGKGNKIWCTGHSRRRTEVREAFVVFWSRVLGITKRRREIHAGDVCVLRKEVIGEMQKKTKRDLAIGD